MFLEVEVEKDDDGRWSTLKDEAAFPKCDPPDRIRPGIAAGEHDDVQHACARNADDERPERCVAYYFGIQACALRIALDEVQRREKADGNEGAIAMDRQWAYLKKSRPHDL